MIIGNKNFDTKNKIYIMGILNVTPDSFSDGGSFESVDAALSRCEKMLDEGADIIDIGGESTRPGYTHISSEEEKRRIIPVINAIKKRFDVPVSVDTYKAATAEAALSEGADMINDIWGFKYDGAMAAVCKSYNACCCLSHNRKEPVYRDFPNDVISDLAESVSIAEAAGIPRDKIIIDPGVGFAKTYEQNLEILRELGRLSVLGLPVLLGVSRKSVIGLTLGLPVSQRVEGTIAAGVIGAVNGASFLRVHDIKENKRAALMTEAIVKNGLDKNNRH